MRRLLTTVCLALGCVPGPAHAGGDAPLDIADRRAFAWFDGIGLPSCAGRPWVRVTRRETTEKPSHTPWTTDGFLLEENPERWTLLRPDQWTESIPRHFESVETTLERLDLAAVAAASISVLRGDADPSLEAKNPSDRLVRQMFTRLGEHATALALARHCAENGLDAVAHDLLDAVRRLPRLRDGVRVEGPIEEIAAEELATSVLWRVTLEFGDASLPRTRLLAEARAYLASFPKSPHRAMAEEAATVLARMVAEEAGHRQVSDADIARLPPVAQAAEWIFRLRDQHGGQFMQPGSPSIYLYEDADTPSPGRRLEAMGWEAVPALIETLEDERFTRTVGFWRDFTFSHYVVRVGDAARQILQNITSEEFWEPSYTAASMVKDGDAQKVKAKYRAWWAECRVLLEPIRALSGEADPAHRLERARVFPDTGPAMIVGPATRARWGTASVLNAIPGLSRDAAADLMRLLVAEAPHPRTRAHAAWVLLDLGDAAAVDSIAALWRGMTPIAKTDLVQGGAVASFLASCGDARGVHALFQGLEAEPAAVRELVVLAFSGHGLGAVRGLAADRGGGLTEPWRLFGEADRAAEAGLAGRLSDLEADPLGKISRQDPLADMDPRFDSGRRVADLASRVLALRWPRFYAMERAPVHSAEEWEATRLRFQSTWRARTARPQAR